MKSFFEFLQKVSRFPSGLWNIMWMPIWKRCMKHCGKGVRFYPMSSNLKGLENLSVGEGTVISKRCTIDCSVAPCSIGRNVFLGVRSTIVTSERGMGLPVVIEDDVCLETNVTILKGVTVGHGSVVLAGSVVDKSFPPYSVIGGIPAKLLKKRCCAKESADGKS